jgi:hypothetical protein
MKTPAVMALVALLPFLTQCRLIPAPPTPPPGWNDETRALLLDEEEMPFGWKAELRQELDDHPRANHVHRNYGYQGQSGVVSQDIWRAYTVADARQGYDEVQGGLFHPRLPPAEMVLDWERPSEIDFYKITADEFDMACGWEEWAWCRAVARYENYVVFFRFDREAELNGRFSRGMTWEEMQQVLDAMDEKFTRYLNSFSTPSP